MNYRKFLGAASAALIIIAILLVLVLAPSVWAQSKYKTLHRFTGGKDGSSPYAGLILDQLGNLYGTTRSGGAANSGTIFQLRPNSAGSWKETVLHHFTGDKDGAIPYAGLILDTAGNLYGTTSAGGAGYGVVFQLTPNADGSWKETVLHDFARTDAYPYAGLIFDQTGDLYGTTYVGYGGTVFELTPNLDGSWTEHVLYGFSGKDGSSPYAGLILDQLGNLYGTTQYGGPYAGGVAFKLSPNRDGSWIESMLYGFCPHGKCRDGAGPLAGLILDPAGNLYGTTPYGGNYLSCDHPHGGCGTVFRLAPNADGGWTESVLYRFTGGKDGARPRGGLIFDAAGNLYGTTTKGGAHGCGVVFKLTLGSDGTWRKRVLHSFMDHPGANPWSGLIFDAVGNLYGTTVGDGTKTFGSVFEITP
jgi:uncharacterized repeat protein (TIGR03803 family)